jgi:hypothetical protein
MGCFEFNETSSAKTGLKAARAPGVLSFPNRAEVAAAAAAEDRALLDWRDEPFNAGFAFS